MSGCFDIEVPTFDIEISSFLCASISKHADRDFDIEVQTFDIEVTIVPVIEVKTLTFDIEGLVFDIVHISISGILLRYRSLARFQMPTRGSRSGSRYSSVFQRSTSKLEDLKSN
jgi:hypothetical protein